MNGEMLSTVRCHVFLILCGHVSFRILSSASPVHPSLRSPDKNCFVTNQNETHYVPEGETLHIPCNVECIPYGDTPLYDWTFSDAHGRTSRVYSNTIPAVLDLNATFDYDSDQDTTALTINQMQKGKEGSYNCSVTYENSTGIKVIAHHTILMGVQDGAGRIYFDGCAVLLAVIFTALAT